MLVSGNAGVLGEVQKGVTAAADALDGLWVGICQLREGFSQLLLISANQIWVGKEFVTFLGTASTKFLTGRCYF